MIDEKLGALDEKRRMVDIIIPTYENVGMMMACIKGILRYTGHNPDNPFFHIWVVNNGEAGQLEKAIGDSPYVTALQEDHNAGWEDAIRDALPYTSAPIVCVMNDDASPVPGNPGWLWTMVKSFWEKPEYGAFGPLSNYAMGFQNFIQFPGNKLATTSVLSGFCLFLRRDALLQAGGFAEGMEGGGDDVDLAIRMKNAGWKLGIRGDVFIYHVGCATGNRLHNDWQGKEKEWRMRRQLIKSYGLKAFCDTYQVFAEPVE